MVLLLNSLLCIPLKCLWLQTFGQSNSSQRQFDRSVHFPVNIADGKEHTLLLSVSSPNAKLFVDNRLIASVDLGTEALSDCSPSGVNCILFVGQRSSFDRNRFYFRGNILRIDLYVDGVVDVDPSFRENRSLINLLDPVSHNTAIRPGPGNVYTFSGEVGLTAFEAPSFSDEFTMIWDVKQTPGTSGILFSLDSDLFPRIFSLFSSDASGSMILFYRARSFVEQQHSIRITYRLADDLTHTIKLSISGSKMDVWVDNVPIATAVLVSPIAPCPDSDGCKFHVGQQTTESNGSGPFVFQGIIFRAILFPELSL